MAYRSRALSVIQKRKIVVSEWIKSVNDVTPHAMKLFNTEKLLVARQTVVVGDEPIFYVFDAFDSRSNTSKNAHVYEVNMYTGVCTRCTVSEQLRIPCRHIQAVIYDRFKNKDAGVAQYDVRKYFHSAYLVRHLQDAVESLSIQLPLEAELLDSNDVKPPPMYRQARRSSTRMPVKDTPDIVRGSKRKQNRGEDASRSRYCGGEGLDIAVENLSDEDSKRVSAFFDTQLSAASVVKRNMYRCSKCGKNGHNKRRYNATTADIEEEGGIQPGEYVVGGCPFVASGKLTAYTNEVKRYQ